MPSRPKIKLLRDSIILRSELDELCDSADSKTLTEWAIITARRALAQASAADELGIIERGFAIAASRSVGRARAHDVRQAGFAVHSLARECGDAAKAAAIRTAGHAIGCAHMSEHAMVASDYAVKTVEILHPDDYTVSERERRTQIESLLSLIR